MTTGTLFIAIGGLGAAGFILSAAGTAFMKWFSPRIGFVDKPGHRKIHQQPKPLGGGVAITLAIALPMALLLAAAWLWNPAPTSPYAPYIGGIHRRTPLALAILGAVVAMHLVGLRDDRRALGPYIKLAAQLAVAGLLTGVFELRALTALGPVGSTILTVLWIAAITNAFNFLDNMDGLSAGVAAVCAGALLVAALSIGQLFVAANLALLLGALLGFLCFNFPPATIFMGDSGSLVVGLMLGILTVRTTFLEPTTPFADGWYAVFAPVIVLALPLYDLIIVSVIRLARGKSPFVGDTNHFSHRLVARGMSRRAAVLCLYLVTATTSVAAIVLPQVRTTFAAMLLFAQTILILGVVFTLERHPIRPTQTPATPPPNPGENAHAHDAAGPH